MTEKEYKVVIGSLLHDIGKIIYRMGDGRTHSKSGHDFLKNEVGITDQEVLDEVLFHHGTALKGAGLERDSLAYITYIADNIAAGADRRKKDAEDYGFEATHPLQPVFNILNGNQGNLYYNPMMLGEEINFPTKEKKTFDQGFYAGVANAIKNALAGLEWKDEYVNSLLEALESCCSFVPSSTAKDELADISLYDHVKMTAAIASCIYQYLQERQEEDYKTVLFENAQSFYAENAFLLVSLDVSGIQPFIYTIQSKDALKMLRARSFYLEIMMEHLLDQLLERVSLSRANRIYSGGGHAYLLLPNTEKVKSEIRAFDEELKKWFLSNFDNALYMAVAFAPACANTLKNIPDGSYAEMFGMVSRELSERKRMRYRPEDIRQLNSKQHVNYARECAVCRRLDKVSEEGICDICSALKNSSKNILYAPFFVVLKEPETDSLPLPGDLWLIAENEDELRRRMAQNANSFVRAYAKNKAYTGLRVATKIWVGNYTAGLTFEELAVESIKDGRGIERLGVLRADVDYLGQAFVAGFRGEHSTLSRTATLSRHLSLFFKNYINKLLEGYNATIVYSGGDDVFLVGAWDETMKIAEMLSEEFTRYTQGTLSISAGEGIYPCGYPIHQMAREVGELEDESKHYPGKAAFTILPDGEVHHPEGAPEVILSDGTYSWKEFRERVRGEKLSLLQEFFAGVPERGTAFLYHLLELIRGRDEKINFARYVYLISRLEPSEQEGKEKRDLYKKFSRQMYEWMKNPGDCRELKTAMTIYSYQTRKKEDANHDHQ